MKRDLVCIGRLIIDSFPKSIRNSRVLFLLLRYLLNVPDIMYTFREKYDSQEISDLSIFYRNESKFNSRKLSNETDINSFHLRKILYLVEKYKPKTILDLGCGNGYLLKKIAGISPHSYLQGVDFNCPSQSQLINFKQLNIEDYIKSLPTNSFDMVLCTHTLEHIPNYNILLTEIKRIANQSLLIICPLEKKFKWGMNYHVNFFSSRKSFLLEMTKGNKSISQIQISTYQRLGDILLFYKKALNKSL